MSCFAKKGRGLLCRTWKRDRIFRHRLRKQLLHVVAKFAELVDRRLVLRFRLTPGRAARHCSSRNVRFEERTANLVLSCGECNLKRGSILGADPESRHRASVKRDCALRRAARFCALKCPVLQKREGAYSVERGSETGSSVIASGNSCSTSSPSSQSSSIAAWCCASASLQVERRATAHRG